MPETDGLFPESQLLFWLPDETFFSFLSRQHLLWGHKTAAQTCQLIFGNARAGKSPATCTGYPAVRPIRKARSVSPEWHRRRVAKVAPHFQLHERRERRSAGSRLRA